MQTSTQAKRRSAVHRPPALPYPDALPASAPHALFWRAHWLRTHAHLQALNDHNLAVWRQRRTTERLASALSAAHRHLQEDAKHEFDCLVRAGGLLYAWLPEGGAL